MKTLFPDAEIKSDDALWSDAFEEFERLRSAGLNSKEACQVFRVFLKDPVRCSAAEFVLDVYSSEKSSPSTAYKHDSKSTFQEPQLQLEVAALQQDLELSTASDTPREVAGASNDGISSSAESGERRTEAETPSGGIVCQWKTTSGKRKPRNAVDTNE